MLENIGASQTSTSCVRASRNNVHFGLGRVLINVILCDNQYRGHEPYLGLELQPSGTSHFLLSTIYISTVPALPCSSGRSIIIPLTRVFLCHGVFATESSGREQADRINYRLDYPGCHSRDMCAMQILGKAYLRCEVLVG